MLKNKSIAANVRFWMVVVAIAPLLIMMIQGYHCARQAVLQLTAGQLSTVVEAKQARVADWFQERQREMQSLAAFATVHGQCVGGCVPIQELFELAQHNNPAYESISLYSKDWKRIAHAGREMPDGEILLDPAFQTNLLTRSGVVISSPHIHKNGDIVIHIGRTAADGTQRVVAVLNLADTLYPLLNPLPSETIPTHSYIVTRKGTLLNQSTDGSPALETTVDLPPEFQQGGNRTATYKNAQNVPVLGAAATLPYLDWLLVSEATTRSAYAWLGVLRERAVITGIITLFSVLVLAWVFARRVTRPLHYMAGIAHRISEGHFGTRMEEQSGREHRELAEAFNRMLDEIDSAQARLSQAAALSAIGELSASIVHEMRNPLSAIKMNLDVLRQAAQGNSVCNELGEIAAEQIQRLEAMLGDLLQYGRILEIQKAPVPVADFMRELEACIRKEEGQEIQFVFRNPNGLETLPIDREQMLRALSNLVDNAVQASPPSGTVTVGIETPAPGKIKIEVADQGSGISDRVGEKLFEPFFTTKKKGTGLGLANVKKIVELHGGSIAFRNTQPGTIFTIVLPNEKESA